MSLFNRGDKSGSQQPEKPQNQTRPAPPPPQPKAEAVILKPTEPPRPAQAEPPRPAPIVQPTVPPTARTGAHMPSVISKTLKIKGQLESSEDIQIDGDIEDAASVHADELCLGMRRPLEMQAAYRSGAGGQREVVLDERVGNSGLLFQIPFAIGFGKEAASVLKSPRGDQL